MESGKGGEEPALEACAASVEEAAGVGRVKNHPRDVHILSTAFFFLFSAVNAAQNLQSSVNTEHNLGVTSVGILYTSAVLFAWAAGPLVRALGSKRAVVLGAVGCWLFIAANLKPSWYTMVPVCVYVGFSSSLLWVGQGTYLTSAACSHARDRSLHEGQIIGNFNGEFRAILACSQVVGNLVPLVLLKISKTSTGTTLLFSVFLVSVTLGIVVLCFLSKRDDKRDEEDLRAGPRACSAASFFLHLKSAISPLLQKRMLLLVPLLNYLGLQRAFASAEFTKYVVKPALGVSGVGGAMAVYGTFDGLSSLVGGRLTSSIRSVTIMVSIGALLQLTVFLLILLKHSSTAGGVLGTVYPLLLAALLGVGDGALNTQLSVLVGMLFKNDMESAFAQMKIWLSFSSALIFFLSPHITLQAMAAVMVSALCASMMSFLYLTVRVEGGAPARKA